MHGSVSAAALLLALAAATVPQKCLASIYSIEHVVDMQDWQGPTTEGPMYALKDFPGISTGTPFVAFSGEASLASSDPLYAGNLSIIFSSNPTRLSTADINGVAPCSSSNIMELSSEIVDNFGILNEVQSFYIKGGEKLTVNAKAQIAATGFQYVTFVFCTDKDTPVQVSGQLEFRNPFGYLPALLYGFLPFSGVLAVLYFILACVYGLLAIRYRDSMLKIQVFIFLVILMGFIETTTWFLTYEVMNESGQPTCCPVRNDIVFAIVVNNVKRVVSALLVLSVSIGWGVAKPTLDLTTNLKITILGFFYLAFSVYYDMRRIRASSDGVPEDTQMLWALPVAVCDVIFVFWIYYAIGQVQDELHQLKQHAKLEMYQKLSRTLTFWVVIWVLYTFFSIFVNNGWISLSWKYMFLMFGFWDVMYFGILVSIANIWLPSPTASAYAYSQQIPTTDVLDEFDNSALEMSAPNQATTSKAAQVAPDSATDNDEDDVDIDIGLENGRGRKQGSGR